MRLAENAWNSRAAHIATLAYTKRSQGPNRSEPLTGQDQIHAVLTRNWVFAADNRMTARHVSLSDRPTHGDQRLFH